jgi:type VI secretion system protein ImpH
MASARRRPDSSLIADLVRHPQAYTFFQAIRLVERAAAESARRSGLPAPDPVGHGSDPQNAALYLRCSVPLGYASAEVTDLHQNAGRWEMTQTVIGLTGSSGVMPHAFSELVQATVRQRNPALREFLDLFNNRLASLLYDAWAKHQIAVESERRDLPGTKTAIDNILRSAVGLGMRSLKNRMSAPDAVVIHYGGLLSRQSHSAMAAEQVLSGALGQPVRVEQFCGEWLPIARPDQTQLPGPEAPQGMFCKLGEDVVLGERTWNVEGAVRLHIGPMPYHVFASFLPGGRHAALLADFAPLALGADIAFIAELKLLAAEVPPLRLDPSEDAWAANRLGWNTWLGCEGTRTADGEAEFRSTLLNRSTHERAS